MKDNEFIREFENERITPWLDKLPKPYYHISLNNRPNWKHDPTDFFKHIDDATLANIKQRKQYLIFDWTDEGFSLEHFGVKEQILHNIALYDIDPKMVIYLSSNFKDNFVACDFWVLGFDNFSTITWEMAYDVLEPEEQWERCVRLTNQTYQGNKFLSLSRVFREHRCMAAFYLSTSKIKDQGLISHGPMHDWEPWWCRTADSKISFKKWKRTLPRVLDRKDFTNNNNWQYTSEAEPLFTSTLFQIANESQVDDVDGTAMFLTEKTFKSIYFMQPVYIYGQPNVNHYLKDLGYRTYENWFALEIDHIQNFEDRYLAMLNHITKLCKRLSKQSKQDQIQWRYKNKELLIHNYKHLISRSPANTGLERFINDITVYSNQQ